jgi:hypothetical protein
MVECVYEIEFEQDGLLILRQFGQGIVDLLYRPGQRDRRRIVDLYPHLPGLLDLGELRIVLQRLPFVGVQALGHQTIAGGEVVDAIELVDIGARTAGITAESLEELSCAEGAVASCRL